VAGKSLRRSLSDDDQKSKKHHKAAGVPPKRRASTVSHTTQHHQSIPNKEHAKALEEQIEAEATRYSISPGDIRKWLAGEGTLDISFAKGQAMLARLRKAVTLDQEALDIEKAKMALINSQIKKARQDTENILRRVTARHALLISLLLEEEAEAQRQVEGSSSG
jgi:hypothetical protein